MINKIFKWGAMERLHGLLIRRNDRAIVQLFRYGLVSAVALAVDFGTYALLVKALSVHPVAAATIAFTLGLTTNYLLSIRWVFHNRHLSARAEFAGFAIIGLIGLLFTDVIIWLMAVEAGQDELLAKIVATAIVFFWNFGARKFVLFNSKERHAEE